MGLGKEWRKAQTQSNCGERDRLCTDSGYHLELEHCERENFMLIVLCILKFSSYDQIQSYPCFRNSRMQGDNHAELAQYALENLVHRLEKDRETNRIRAVKYRQKKKQ